MLHYGALQYKCFALRRVRVVSILSRDIQLLTSGLAGIEYGTNMYYNR